MKAKLIKSLMETNEKCDHAALGKMAENVTALEDVIRIIREYEEITKPKKRRSSALRLGKNTCLKRSGKLIFFKIIDLRKSPIYF